MIEKPFKSTLIVDLDNTLFDWFEQWYYPFSTMLKCISEKSGIAEDRLKEEFRVVHKKHGTSEYAFSLQELPSLTAKYPNEDLAKLFDDAIHAFRSERKKHLRLYPTVLQTLSLLKSKGTLIVAYTESMAFYSGSRIKKLGLDGLIDYLYSPADHDLPNHLTPEQIRAYPAEAYEFQSTIHRHTPKGELKPNPVVLKQILQDLSVAEEACVYVGDSLMKDVAMANAAGVTSVHAEYGVIQSHPGYKLLQEVSHWTDTAINKEGAVTIACTPPNHILRNNLSEVLTLFNFGNTSNYDDASLAIWEKTIEVQQHFNELSVKVRALAITVVGAVLSAIAFALKEQLSDLTLVDSIPTVVPVLFLIASVAWLAFWVMDQFWYHRLLKGAVLHGLKIEKALVGKYPHIGLT